MFHCICMPHFVYLSVSGHLSSFYILATVNNAAMNIGIQISPVPAFNYLGYIPRSGISGSYDYSMFNF